MRSIDVSTGVFSMIWAQRSDGEETENDILQRILSEFSSKVAPGNRDLGEAINTDLDRGRVSGSTIDGGHLELKGSDKSPPHFADTKVPVGKIRWVDDVFEAMSRLGGRSTLNSIYKEVELIRIAGGRSIPKTLEATIRRTIEDHSSDSENHRGPDLFAKIGRGEWEIRREE